MRQGASQRMRTRGLTFIGSKSQADNACFRAIPADVHLNGIQLVSRFSIEGDFAVGIMYQGIDLDLHHHSRCRQAGFHAGGHRFDTGKHFAMRPDEVAAALDIGQESPRPDYMPHLGADTFECIPDAIEDKQRLRISIAGLMQLATRLDRGGAGDENERSHPFGS